MNFIKKKVPGIAVCLGVAIPAWYVGKLVPIIGGAVIAILVGMAIAVVWHKKDWAEPGIKWTGKYILQLSVILLGFGMNLKVIAQTGVQSLPIIACTIATALFLGWLMKKILKMPKDISILVGVGSSICGGSAIAATAPVIDADEEDVAQAFSVIFFYNVLAAILFPFFGTLLGFDTTSGEAFGVFAGTAVNDTSSVTAAASSWDSMWNLGNATLDKAVTVKLTRTLAIIPITIVLGLMRAREAKKEGTKTNGFSFKRVFPLFILFFVAAAVVTTIAVNMGVDPHTFAPLKELSKFFIVLAMGAIGINSNIIKLVKTGGKPILMGLVCWIGVTVVALILQRLMGIW